MEISTFVPAGVKMSKALEIVSSLRVLFQLNIAPASLVQPELQTNVNFETISPGTITPAGTVNTMIPSTGTGLVMVNTNSYVASVSPKLVY